MRANGRPVTYVVFEDEGHGFARPENNRRFTAAMEAFFAEHLGGRYEPASTDEDVAPFLR
jgi:dipeptidyl aminopeptidase/acylaminoacyl peptidase